MEHTATCASKNRVSRFTVLIADFCNKIGTFRPIVARGTAASRQRLGLDRTSQKLRFDAIDPTAIISKEELSQQSYVARPHPSSINA
jgi:hypothetical protein